jgi:GTP-binding protein EngB required for normal cell division
MKDYKTDYIAVANEINTLTKEIVEEHKRKDFMQTITDKIEDFQPSLMLYGTYNAGKSTLLNALYGEERAKTGDAPETSIVTPYDWNGYIIYDTPGIDAPIEHEEITQEHLKTIEIVLFVISNDGAFEERYIYEKIIEIIKAEKPLLIIMNNKAGMDPNDTEFIESINTISKWVHEIGKEKGVSDIDSKFRVLWVDAEVAYEGKTNKEQQLIEYSNIKEIEDKINDIFKKSDIGEVSKTLDSYIIDFIENAIQEADNTIGDKDIDFLQKQISVLYKDKEKNIVKLHNFIDTETQLLSEDIREKLIAGMDEYEINSYINIEMEDLSSKINQHIEVIQNKLIQDENDFANSPEGIELAKKIIHTIQNEEETNNTFETNKYFNEIKEQLKQGITNEKLVKEVSVETFKLLRSMGVKGFKWRWGSTLNKWADKVAKGLGPTVRVISSIYDAYQANKAEQEFIEKKRQFAQHAKTEAEKISKEIKNDIYINLDDVISSLYDPLINKKTEQIEIIKKDTKTANKIKRELSAIRSKINLS